MTLDEASRKIRELEEENAQLRRRLYFLEYAPTLAHGLQGEQLVAHAVEGSMTTFTAGADVRIERNQMLLEVKFSTLNVAVKGNANQTLRWTWSRPLGYSGGKVYDRLILVGHADPRHRALYLDEEPYVFFDVPYAGVEELQVQGGTHMNIQITTNPRTARTDAAKKLFGQYMVSFAELNARYGILGGQGTAG